MDNNTNNEELVSVIREMFEKIPFNKVFGLKVESISSDCVKTLFEMQDEWMGQYKWGCCMEG